ncbi:MAG TPA: superoxide dismutase family protein [Burkholderiales bacterium]|nr:superoxide dismutase family protein [Burkholderiales bacterium]
MRTGWTIAVAALALTACATAQRDVPTARAELVPTAGNQAKGTVNFAQYRDKVRVSGKITGLVPNSQHGFHVHEKGDCSAPDATSAGGHFNPLNKAHGHAVPGGRHAGDMPNLRADGAGQATFSFDLSGMSVNEGETNVVGRSVIVHAKPDDYRTQPTGDAGARLACGVIEKR